MFPLPSFKKLLTASAVASAVAVSGHAAAGYTYTFQNVVFSFNAVSDTQATFNVHFNANTLNSPDFYGDWTDTSGLWAFSLGFPNPTNADGIDFSVLSSTVTTTASTVQPSTWDGILGKISANACGFDSGNDGSVCYEGPPLVTPGNFSVGFDLTFNILLNNFDSTNDFGNLTEDSLIHLMVNFVQPSEECNVGNGGCFYDGTTYWKKLGSNLSQNLAFADDTVIQDDDDTIPEPGTIALLGIGLAGMSAVRRRKMS